MRFLIRSTVDQHPTVELDSLGTDYSTVPIPSHSTRTYVILLLDFSTKDLLTTSAVGTTTALTRLTHISLLLPSATLAPLDDIPSLSVGSALGQQLSQLLDSFNSCLFTVSSSQSSAAHSGTHQTYSTFHVTLAHVGLQTLLQDITLSSS